MKYLLLTLSLLILSGCCHQTRNPSYKVINIEGTDYVLVYGLNGFPSGITPKIKK